MTDKKADPTKDPEFQKVVRRFLKTPPKPHKPKKEESKNEEVDRSHRCSTGRPTDKD